MRQPIFNHGFLYKCIYTYIVLHFEQIDILTRPDDTSALSSEFRKTLHKMPTSIAITIINAITFPLALLGAIAGQAHFTDRFTPAMALNVNQVKSNSYQALWFLHIIDFTQYKYLFGTLDACSAPHAVHAGRRERWACFLRWGLWRRACMANDTVERSTSSRQAFWSSPSWRMFCSNSDRSLPSVARMECRAVLWTADNGICTEKTHTEVTFQEESTHLRKNNVMI